MKRHESRLGATEMTHLRRVGVTKIDRVRNADVREAVRQGGNGEGEKEAKSVEGEVRADGRWKISEESVHGGNYMEIAERKTKKESF